MLPLFLASQSPRRRELLKKAGITFSVASVEVSEIPDKNINANEQILDIARRKAEASLLDLSQREKGPFLVLSADTEVVLDNELLGKPKSPEHAAETLKRLSGQKHEVITAVVLKHSPSGIELNHIETTIIVFKNLSDQDIASYVSTGEPMDKAGSYGIQGLGGQFVEKINGDFENVVGLPTSVVHSLLSKISTMV